MRYPDKYCVGLHAIEPTRPRGRRRVDGVGRPKFDFHTVRDVVGRRDVVAHLRVDEAVVPEFCQCFVGDPRTDAVGAEAHGEGDLRMYGVSFV